MITDNNQENTEDKWHYIALKSIPIILVAYNDIEQIMHLKNTKDYVIITIDANR